MDGKEFFGIIKRRIAGHDNGMQARLAAAAIAIAACSACGCGGNTRNGGYDRVASEPASVVAQDDSACIKTYPVADSCAGPFRIGAVIRDTMDGFEVEKSTECRTVADGVTIEIPIYTYYIGNEGWVKVTPRYDTVTGQASDKIGEIYLFSDLFLTDKGIGAISSLEEFAGVYPDVNIRYIGEDDMFAIETPQLPSVQFLLSGEHYTGSEHGLNSSSGGALNVSDFEEKSYFDAIRISQQ